MNLAGSTESTKHLQLNGVVLTATSDEVRKIAEFFSDTADRMDSMGSDYDYDHLSDHTKGFESSPHIIVVHVE